MLPLIIAGSALGGAALLKIGEYSYTYLRGKYAPTVKPRKKNARKPKVDAAPATPKPKNTRRTAATIVEKAEAATKKATISDAKPEPTKVGQGRGSLGDQLASKIATGEVKP